MKNTILNKINNNPLSFDELFTSINSEQTITKQELSFELKSLQNDKQIIEFNQKIINITTYPKKEGFVHWSINNLAWIEPTDNTNDFGIAHDYKDKDNIINNKKAAELGTKVEYIELSSDEKKYSHIINTIDKKELNLIVSKKHRGSQILNTNFNFDTSFELPTEYNNNDIAIIKRNIDGEFSILKKIGNIKDKGIESSIVTELLELKSPPKIPLNTNNILLDKSYKNITNIPFLTIDSATTKDVDDAIYIEKTLFGFSMFVAIADVDYYVKQNTEADLHAQKMGTTFYLNNDKIPMFDSSLSENLSSLNLNETRPAFVCELNYDDNFNLQNYQFFTCPIKVASKISYNDINNIINDTTITESFFVNDHNYIEKLTKENIPKQTKELIQLFETISTKLKKKQPEKEYWFVQTPDFQLGEDGKINTLFLKNESESNPAQTIVETAMLATNISAAQLLMKNFPEIGIFRNQINLDSTQKPKPALYHNENNGHWGLQEETYTHFTSPIRRYCDLIAHRIIKSCINKEPSPYSHQEIISITEQSNNQQYLAKQANIKEKNLLLNQYLATLIEKNELSNKYEVVDYNKSGALIRNKQLIDAFVPYFKLDKDIQNYLLDNLLETPEKQKHIDHINKNWQIKCFIDRHNWFNDKKEFQIKIYKKENTNNISIKI